MSAEDEDDDKQYEATQKRLDDARARGEVPRSQDITTAAGYGGLLLAATAFGPASLDRLGTLGKRMLDQPEALASSLLADGNAGLASLLFSAASALAPLLLIPGLLVLLSLFAQRALLFTPSKLMPKGSRISPLSNAKNKFGRGGLFEFGKSFVKLLVLSAMLGLFLTTRMDQILGTIMLAPGAITLNLLRLLQDFLLLILVLATVIGAIDYLWQQAEHQRRNRMSRKEMTDEMKDAEGDPHLKQKRRQRGYEIATRRMIADVAKSDVVIVNPTHYAVALKWQRGDRRAPICMAKGVDEIAARIREAASTAGIPIRRDPPTARRLHDEIEIGEEIWPEHFRAVAAAIRFAEAMQAKAQRTWR